MSEQVFEIVDNVPLTAVSPPRFELPRLQIMHLMLWTAATAVAFVPYRVQQAQLQRNFSNSTSASSSSFADMRTSMELIVVWQGITQGAFLFVAAAMIAWRRRGYEGPPQPGHYFAYQGAALWAASVVGIPLLSLQPSGARPLWSSLTLVVSAIVGVFFFFWFLRLAGRRSLPALWRWAFAVAAFAPVVSSISMVAVAFSMRGNPQQFMSVVLLVQIVTQGTVALIVGLAMWKDRSISPARHWSHWVGAGTQVAVSCGYLLIFGGAVVLRFFR